MSDLRCRLTAGVCAVLLSIDAMQAATLQNPDFEAGAMGGSPPGWTLFPFTRADPNTRSAISDAGHVGQRCVVLVSDGETSRGGALTQTIDAAPFRGKQVRFRAAVRAEVVSPTAANLYLRVDGADGDDGHAVLIAAENTFARPIVSSQWSYHDISVHVDFAATSIMVGCTLNGPGKAWFDDASFEVVGPAAAKSDPARFPKPFNSERDPSRPMSPDEAARAISGPPGFHTSVFAAEPEVQQPIAMTTDARGRLWVAENYTYPFNHELHDRIVILEDTDNDGRADKRTVFWDGARHLTSIEIGNGGVWALCLPNLVFIPDRNGDDVPDGPIETVLDGFDFGGHNFANGLRWGPDGWLYGRQGILHRSLVGRPGTPREQRTSIGPGVWRYQPRTGALEIVAEGTTNPWGMDWDAKGEAFFINTVIGHLWHLIPGAHYRRMYGEDLNTHVYELIDQHADHVHWATGEVWGDAKKGLSSGTSAAGGGHAHTGLLIYQGGQWPDEWNGKLLTLNFHGRRINAERLERVGSGFVGRHEPDAFQFADTWFRGIDLIAAPDGGVFVSDWCDAGECHDYDGIHRTSGRIFKIGYGNKPEEPTSNLERFADAKLVQLQSSRNDWFARQARRVLANRAENGADLHAAHEQLWELLRSDGNAVNRLRALWALHVSKANLDAAWDTLARDADESVRVWAIRLMTEPRGALVPPDRFAVLQRLGKSDPSELVRLALASTLQRLVTEQRAALAETLLGRSIDERDHNLPLVLWYGVEPLAATAAETFDRLVATGRVATVQRLGARRIAETGDTAGARLNALLKAAAESSSTLGADAIIAGVVEGLKGRRRVAKPADWESIATRLAHDANETRRIQLRDLGVVFGEGRAMDEVRAVALDGAADFAQRRAALQVLIETQAPGVREVCETLLETREIAAAAAAGLAMNSDEGVADRLIGAWSRFANPDRPKIIDILLSRPSWAGKALDAIAAGKLPRNLSRYEIRKISSYPALMSRADEIFGPAARNDLDRGKQMATWRERLTPEVLAAGDKMNGRTVFRAVCATCHMLNGEGGNLGPDLTGSGRDNLDYILENVLFPSERVADAYRLTTLTMKDGRTLSGMVRERTPAALKLQTPVELMLVPLGEIADTTVMSESLMPAGLLDGLEFAQARDLVAFLMTK